MPDEQPETLSNTQPKQQDEDWDWELWVKAMKSVCREQDEQRKELDRLLEEYGIKSDKS